MAWVLGVNKQVAFFRKLICGYCGRPVSAETGTARNGEIIHYYKCIERKKDHNGCTKSAVKKEELEKIVLDSIIEEMGKPEIMENAIATLMMIQQKQMTDNSVLKLLQGQKNATDRALSNLMTAIENGIISNTTNKRLHELKEQQKRLEREILIKRSKCAVTLSEQAIREYYQQALRLESQMLISYLVKQIVLFEDKIEIHFNNPLRTSPDDDRDFSICTKKVKLGFYEVFVQLKL